MRRIFFILLAGFWAAGLCIPQVVFAGAVLHINTEAGVSIWLNNELIGITAEKEKGLTVRNLEPGEYTLRAARKGYDSTETLITVKDKQTIEWRIHFVEPVMKIEKAVKRLDTDMIKSVPAGTLFLRSIPLNAEIFLNGKSIGSGDRKISYMPEADYSVKFVFKGRDLSEKLSLQTDEIAVLTADFTQGKIVKEIVRTHKGRGPAVIKMKTSRAKKPAMFPHRRHQGMYDCDVCHHGMDAEGNKTPYVKGMEIQHCVTCHNPKMANKKLNNLMQASHVKCKGCHKKVVEETGTAGPIGKCSGCHNVPEGE